MSTEQQDPGRHEDRSTRCPRLTLGSTAAHARVNPLRATGFLPLVPAAFDPDSGAWVFA